MRLHSETVKMKLNHCAGYFENYIACEMHLFSLFSSKFYQYIRRTCTFSKPSYTSLFVGKIFFI
jgi:hypothetical protein